ncbi:DivIVA domain-containing protein [Nocardia otitidiscaviarum]|uniref:DivIVA domain-containing protein n=1 Tax=Nocardia otitidiscaviarum TaxID=1823 RepID=UPI0004A6F077|nr:DivIVA domain-containing protein [Nocardia otitidiscaviarum]MBF6487077.1 DivIVA domain-containing protein [Nocardia otitidiscaviarum]
MTRVTPEEVRRKRFGKARHHGYNQAEVDAFCARIADTILGRDHLTAADIRQVQFGAPPFGHRGYDQEQVDDFLDHVCIELEYLRRGRRRVPTANVAPALTHDDVLRIQFSAPPYGLPGYAAAEVGAFLDRLAATLAHDGPSRLTADEVRHTEFHTAAHGYPAYHREEVDAFLDLVVRQLERQL